MTNSLAGVRVIVTRPSSQESGLPSLVKASGGTVMNAPLIRVTPRCSDVLSSAVLRLSDYDAVLVTSANAIAALRTCISSDDLAEAVAKTRGLACYVVGAATGLAAESIGFNVVHLPEAKSAHSLCEALISRHVGETNGRTRALYLMGQRASVSAFDPLVSHGWLIDAVVCYDTMDGPVDADAWEEALRQPGEVVIALYSPSAAQVLARSCAQYLDDAVAHVLVVCIGETTARAAKQVGIQVNGVAAQPTDEAMLTAMISLIQNEGRKGN